MGIVFSIFYIFFTCFLAVIAMPAFADLSKQSVCSQSKLLEDLDKEQCEALIDLYNATDGDNWHNNRGWGSTNISSWVGVIVQDKHVVAIGLLENNLRGELPASFGALPTQDVHLSGNKLNGRIPVGVIGGLRESGVLGLTGNNLSGALPDDFSEAPAYSVLHLSDNALSGPVPPSIYDLEERDVLIFLGNNKLSGAIPTPPETKPSKGYFTLRLNNNLLSGEIPPDLFKRYNVIFLNDNNLSGAIPEEINEFSGSGIRLQNNKLDGVPDELSMERVIGGLDISGNAISGKLPRITKAPLITVGGHSFVNFSGNKFSGTAVEFVNDIGVVGFVDLSDNDLSGSLKGIENSKVINLNLSGNRFTDLPNTFSGSNFEGIDFSKNRITGVVPDFDLTMLRKVDLSSNNLHGDIPLPSPESYQYLREYNLSNNQFSGELPDEIMNLALADINVSGNRLHGDLDSFKRKFESKNRHASIKVVNQLPYQLSGDSQDFARVLQRYEGGDAAFLINFPQGMRLQQVTGCDGALRGNIFRVRSGQRACDVRVQLEQCNSDRECLMDLGETQGLRNAHIESPAQGTTVSGVVQFRGWLHEAEIRTYKSFDTLNPRKAKLLIDGSEIPLDINFNRLDVAKEMGYNEDNQIPVGWSALFYAGNLSNGLHTATLVNNEGAVVDTVDFYSFTLQDESGKTTYVSNNSRELLIEDLPYPGSALIIRFNQSEQSFSIIDQLNRAGESKRSGFIHYSENELTPQNAGVINGVPRVKIETPNSSSDLLGVASLRGWAYGSELLNGPLYMTLDDGMPFLLPRGERSDVEHAMGINTGTKLGWSQLFYAGNLLNGRHRLRLFGDKAGEKVLLAESYFESFVPLDEQGWSVYLQTDKTVEVRDFPFEGSKVQLRFDKAGQNFVPVSQVVQ